MKAAAAAAMQLPDSLIKRLLHYAEVTPDHDAVVSSSTRISYSQLSEWVRCQARVFADAGISKDSVVAIRCPDDAQHLILCLAAIHSGATSFTLPTHDSAKSLSDLKDRCGTTHVVTEVVSPQTFVDLQGQDAITPIVEARLLFSTSGTTGDAKLVVHHDNDLVAQAHRHIDSNQERFACLASMEHNFAKRHRLYCVAAGATNVLIDSAPESLPAQCQGLGVQVLHVTAFQARELLATAGIHTLSHIRLKLGGSHVPLSLRRQLRENITENLQAGYGTTETGAIAFTDPNDADAGESVGRPLPGIEVRSVSPEREPLGTAEPGELAIRCKGLFREYLEKPDLTEACRDNGWFYTGDIGYLDSEQRIHLCGRSDDMFMFNSMNIYPQDIESQICQFAGVTDAAVLAKPSPVHGNIPVALVAFAEGETANVSGLKAFLQERVGARCPRQITSVDRIPRNAIGKIAREATKNLFAKSEEIRSALINSLNNSGTVRVQPAMSSAFLDGDTDIFLRDIEVDSLARMDLMVMLEVQYDVIISPQEFIQHETLGSIASWATSAPAPSGSSRDNELEPAQGNVSELAAADQAHLLKLFRRAFRLCETVAHLNKVLTTFGYRLTPEEVGFLHDRHAKGRLIPSTAAQKFQLALGQWLQQVNTMMLASGKRGPESFQSKKLTSTVRLFSGPGQPDDKTLIVCFSGAGDRELLMPNAVLLQHTDASRFDLMVVAEPLKQGYRLGVPLLGKTAMEVIESLAGMDIVRNYRQIRTLGCSAGGYVAILAGYLLNAELAISVGGRFHSERHPGKILERIVTTWRASRRGRCSRVVMSYAADKSRDRNYARIISKLTGGSLVAVRFADAPVGHLILKRLAERGELAALFERTVFAPLNDDLLTAAGTSVVIDLPENSVSTYR